MSSERLARKVRWRLAVPTILFMLLSSLDRVNVSFAALQMNQDLGFSPSQFGLGAGILFVGFLAGQYPSVLALQHLGMRRWISLCALLWGLCAAGIAFVRTPLQFDALRVVLGLAEAGLAPGIVLYLSQFATERERATTFALPMLAIPLSLVIGSPISGWLMTISPPFPVAAWRWMLIAEALPTVLLGALAWFYFPDRPAEASWLSAAEREWLEQHAALRSTQPTRNDWSVLNQAMVWLAALLWFGLLSGSYGIMFWLPQTIKQLAGLGPVQIGLVNALPWAGAMVGMYCNSQHSDRTAERFWHIGLPAALAGAAILAAWRLGPGAAGLVALLLAGVALGAAQGAFWALPTMLLTPARLAVAAVAINTCGSSGGLVMPHLVGYVREQTGSFSGPAFLIALMLMISAMLVPGIRLLIPRRVE